MTISSQPSQDREILNAATTALIDKEHSSNYSLRPRFIFNNYHQGRKVSSALEAELQSCSSFDFSVAFITKSGLIPLLQTLKQLEKKGTPGRILTTDYLNFSEPKALEQLESFSNIELRVFKTQNKTKNFGFHTKGYLFTYPDSSKKAIIGSSNLTGSALAVNHEWNLQFTSKAEGELVQDIEKEFDLLWDLGTPLSGYIEEYRRLYEEKKTTLSQQKIIAYEQATLEPNAMQVSFIANLSESLNKGDKRALLISATGTGKTYASAFAVRRINPKRTLFLAHREQVLKQSMKSYRRVLGNTKTYGLLSGNSHEKDTDLVFATMQTMSRDHILNSFNPTDFDVIIIDEVHRAGAESYQKIINYFEPSLYFGMTASPDRTDGYDIYKLFDNNIVYEIRLQRALEEDLLCPFHYFGITDLAYENSVDPDFADFNCLVSDSRIDHILKQANYYGFSGDRVKGLVFCSTNRECQELSRLFNLRGYSTLALSGANTQEERERAIERLIANPGDGAYENKLDYIFTVDIFNEGIDIPDVNQVIMLRPTESPIIFVQQLGRGLRKAPNKEYVVILDFIGNYTNNYMIPIALSGDRSYNKDNIRKFLMEGDRIIPGCSSIHFDEIAQQRIFESIDNSAITMKLLREKYQILRHKLGKIPSMTDFFDYGEIDPLLFVQKKGSYYRFLAQYENDFETNALSEKEHLILEYTSSYFGNGMRPHELIVLKDLVEEKIVTKDSLVSQLFEYDEVSLTDSTFNSAVRVLDKTFIGNENGRKKFKDIQLISLDENTIVADVSFAELLKNEVFKKALLDVIDFGLLKYEEKYASSNDGLALYEKYSRKDACRLLNWQQDDSSTMYGYRIKHNTCPIFVTYNKNNDISSSTQYEDEFESRQLFSWMTRSRLTLKSPEVQSIINSASNGLQIYLFVKKSDSEGSDFYFMGKANPIKWTQTTIKNDNGDELPIVNFKLELEHAVQDDIYEYFAGSQAS